MDSGEKTDPDTLDKKYIDPATAKIVLEHLAELKHKTSIADEQLQLLIKDNINEI